MKLSFFRRVMVVTVLALSVAYTLPNLLPESLRDKLPDFMPIETVNLGLDLQGGSHLVLEVDTEAVFKRAYENLEDEVRQTLRAEKERYRDLTTYDGQVMFTLLNPKNSVSFAKALQDYSRLDIVDKGNGHFSVSLTDSAITELQRHVLAQTVEVLRARVDEFGVSEPLIQQQGYKRVIVELPGIDDVARAKAIIGRTAQLTFHLVDDSLDPYTLRRVPANRLRLFEVNINTFTGEETRTPIIVKKRPSLTGELLTKAGAGFDQMGQPSVDISFNSKGTKKFGKLSVENTGKRFAIVLDGEVYSAPVFREAILGGRAQITGNFGVQESQDLATILNAGALPAPVKVVEERTVGPSLGADSVYAGQLAIFVGFIAVLIFMVIFYGLFGMAANIALISNVFILVGIMSAVGFTLTLPGMAGIVLTIGMAVDANVLIFERIREEIANGKKPYSAVLGGFDSAFVTILDANLTTLIASIVLFAMGSGPIKGFALTLSIGVMASMFTAILLTKWIILIWMSYTKPKTLKV